MSALAFIGSILLAYGMPVTFLLAYVSRRALLLLFATAAAFAWIAAALLVGIIWAAAQPLQDVSEWCPLFHCMCENLRTSNW